MVVMEENKKIMSVQKFLEQINYVYLNKYPSKNPKKIVIPHVRVQRLPSHIIAKYTKRSNPENTQSSVVGCKEKIKAQRPTDESLCTVGSDKNESIYNAVQASVHTDSSDSDFPDLMNPKIYEKKNMKKKKKKSTKEVTSGKVLVSKKDIPALMEKAKKLYDSQVKAFKKDKVSKQKQPENAAQSDTAFVNDTVTPSQPHSETENIVNDQAEGTSISPDLNKDSNLVIVSCQSLASSSKDQEEDFFAPPPIPSPISPQHPSSPIQKPSPSLEGNAQKLPDILNKIRANMGKSVGRAVENSSVTHLNPADFSDDTIPQTPREDNKDICHYDSDGKESVGSDETVIFDPAFNRKEASDKDTLFMPNSLEEGIDNSCRLLKNTEDVIKGNIQMNVLQANKKALTDTPQSVTDRPDEENYTDSARVSSKRKSDSLSEDAPNKRIKIEPNAPPKHTSPMVVIPISTTPSVCNSSFKTSNSIDPSGTTAHKEDLSVSEANLPKSHEQGKKIDCSEAVTDSTGPHPEVQDTSNSLPTTSICEIESEPSRVTLEPSVDTQSVSSPLPSEVSNSKSKCQTTTLHESNVSTADSSMEKVMTVDSMRQQPEEMEEEEQRSSSREKLYIDISEEDTSEKEKIIPKTKSVTKLAKGLEADKKHTNSKIRKHKLAAVMDMVEEKNKLEEKIEKLKEEMERKISCLEKKKKKLEMNISKALTQMNEGMLQGTLSSDEDDLEEDASDKDVSVDSASSPSSCSPIPKSDSAHEAAKDPSDGSVAESTALSNTRKGEKMVSGNNSSCVNTETVPKKGDNNKSTVSDKHCASNIKIINAAKIDYFGNPQEQGSDSQNPPHRHKESSTKDVRFQIKAANQKSGKSAVAPDNKNKKGQKKIVNSKQPKARTSSGTDAVVPLDTHVSALQNVLTCSSLSLAVVPKNKSEKSQSMGDSTSTQISQKISLQQPVQTQQPVNKGQGQPKQLLNVVQQPQQVIQQPSQQHPQQVIQQPSQQHPQQIIQQPSPQQPQQVIQQQSQQHPQQVIQQQSQQHPQPVIQKPSQQQLQQVIQKPSQQQPQQVIQKPSQQQPQQVIQQPSQQQPQQVIQQPSQQQPQPLSHQQSQQRNKKPPQTQVHQMKQRPSQKQVQAQQPKQQLQHQETQQAMQQSHQHQIQQVMQQSQPQQPQNIIPNLHQQPQLLLMQQLPQQQSQFVVQQSNQQQPQLVIQQPQNVMQQSNQQQPQLVMQHPQNVMQQSPQQQAQLRKQLQGYPSQVRAQPEKVMNVYQNPQVQQMQIQQNAQQNQLNHWQPRPPQPSVSTTVGSNVGNLTSKNINQKNFALAPRMTTMPVLTTRNDSTGNIAWPVSSAPVVNQNAWQGQQQTASLGLASVTRQSGPALAKASESASSQSSVMNVPQRYSGTGGSQSNFGTTYSGPVSDRCVVVPGGPVTLARYQVGQGKDNRPNTLASTTSSGNLRNSVKKQLLHNQQFGMTTAMRHQNMPHGANIQLPQTNILAGYPQSGAEGGKNVGSTEGAASVEEQQWCFICGKVGEFTCCSGIIYCSDICQRMDWERHSKECKKRT